MNYCNWTLLVLDWPPSCKVQIIGQPSSRFMYDYTKIEYVFGVLGPSFFVVVFFVLICY